MLRPLVILFAKAAVPGRVKTRLCPPLSPRDAAELHWALVADTSTMLLDLADRVDLELSTDFPTDAWPAVGYRRSIQTTGDLGERLLHALASALTAGHEVAIVVGSDSPGLPSSHIRALLESNADVTLGPTTDGGFFAIACRRSASEMFDRVRWSSFETLNDVVAAASRCGLNTALSPSWFDIDVPDDLVRLPKVCTAGGETERWHRENSRPRPEKTR